MKDMFSVQDFAKYQNAVPTKPTVTLWTPSIPSLVLGAVLGSVFTFTALSKMSTAQIYDVPATQN